MSTVIFSLALSLAPVATDRGAASIEVEAAPAVDAWTPAAVEGPAPEPAPAVTPAPMPMPVPVPPPTQGPQPYANPAGPGTDIGGSAPPPTRKRTWPEVPIRWRLDVAGDLGTTVMRDPAWQAFDWNRGAFHIGGTIRGDFRLGDGRVFLGGGATFRRFGGYGRIYDAVGTDIVVRDPLAFLRVSVVAVEGVDVFVQAGAGPSIASLSMSTWGWDYSSGAYATQRAVMAMADAQAGLSLYLPKKWLPRRGSARATAGLELAAGYTFRSKIKVRPELSTGDDPIATHTSEFGGLAVRGFVWRFGLFVRFQ